MEEKQKIVVGVTGASGSIYAKRIFHFLAQRQDVEVGVVFSDNAKTVWRLELGEEPDIPYRIYGKKDYFAPFASGSARYMKMVIVPCSMGTLGRISAGISDDLITRAADVMLKERRQLILIPRDTPLNLIHLENMTRLTRAGAVIMPAMPSYYSNPENFDDLADTVVHRALDMMDLNPTAYRWGEEETQGK